jgi:hypothetical protein
MQATRAGCCSLLPGEDSQRLQVQSRTQPRRQALRQVLGRGDHHRGQDG